MSIHPTVCGIIPPHILDSVRRNGTPEEQQVALETLQIDGELRAERARGLLASGEIPPRQRSMPAPAVPATHRDIYDAQGLRSLPGVGVRGEGGDPTGDADTDRVYDGFGATWDLYYDLFGRDSYDDRAATLTGTVHYDRRYNNAFWNGFQMVFGDGDGRLFSSFTSAIDIMAHELTHAVTENESGLNYQDQAGALNEHLSDVFGALVKQRSAVPQQSAEQADWLIGAGILGPGIAGQALRSMKNPGTAYDDPLLGKDPQPGHMDDFVVTTDDHGGVHINSGIPNRAFVLFSIALGGYAWDRAGRVWYATATDPALHPDATFEQFAQLTVQHAIASQGDEVGQACRDAWAGVGVTWADAPEPLATSAAE
jgi:Zn-dependent metalloprotease